VQELSVIASQPQLVRAGMSAFMAFALGKLHLWSEVCR
jgi:hypothetical protein